MLTKGGQVCDSCRPAPRHFDTGAVRMTKVRTKSEYREVFSREPKDGINLTNQRISWMNIQITHNYMAEFLHQLVVVQVT